MTIAVAFDWKFARIQFTPDLMPSDITGYELLGRDASSPSMVFRPRPRPGEPRPRRRHAAVALAAPDVIVIGQPGRLKPEVVRQLASLLKRGRGVFCMAAVPEDATNLKLLADAAGNGLKSPVEFVPPAGGIRRKNLFLTAVKKDEPPFAVFGDGLSNAIDGLRFACGLSTRRRDEGLADDVLATFNDRTACLVVTGCGDGTLAVLNADLAASALPTSPAFVPIVGELTARLVGRPRAA